MASHIDAWADTYNRCESDTGYTPREVKAQAMALTVLGYSSRAVERELKAMFPGKRIPPWSTIARWQRSRPMTRTAALRWADVALRASEIVGRQLDLMERDIVSVPFKDIMTMYKVTHDVYDRARLVEAGSFDGTFGR